MTESAFDIPNVIEVDPSSSAIYDLINETPIKLEINDEWSCINISGESYSLGISKNYRDSWKLNNLKNVPNFTKKLKPIKYINYENENDELIVRNKNDIVHSIPKLVEDGYNVKIVNHYCTELPNIDIQDILFHVKNTHEKICNDIILTKFNMKYLKNLKVLRTIDFIVNDFGNEEEDHFCLFHNFTFFNIKCFI